MSTISSTQPTSDDGSDDLVPEYCGSIAQGFHQQFAAASSPDPYGYVRYTNRVVIGED